MILDYLSRNRELLFLIVSLMFILVPSFFGLISLHGVAGPFVSSSPKRELGSEFVLKEEWPAFRKGEVFYRFAKSGIPHQCCGVYI